MADATVKNHDKGRRVLAIVVGIVLIGLGVLFFVFPLKSMLFVDIFITIGLLIFGIFRIINFIATPSGYRDGWQLAFGILWIVCALIILASNASSIVVSFAILLGVLALLMGLNQTISYASLRGMPGAGFILASGIINILLAVFLLLAPFVATAAVGIIQGIYLCFAGIALVVEGFAKNPIAMD